jgi:hypothetical protein
MLYREFILLRDLAKLLNAGQIERSAVFQALKYAGVNVSICLIWVVLNEAVGGSRWIGVFIGLACLAGVYEYLRGPVISVAYGDVVQVRSIGHYDFGWPPTVRTHRFVDIDAPKDQVRPNYTFIESYFAKNEFPDGVPMFVTKHPSHCRFVVPVTTANIDAYCFDKEYVLD